MKRKFQPPRPQTAPEPEDNAKNNKRRIKSLKPPTKPELKQLATETQKNSQSCTKTTTLAPQDRFPQAPCQTALPTAPEPNSTVALEQQSLTEANTVFHLPTAEMSLETDLAYCASVHLAAAIPLQTVSPPSATSVCTALRSFAAAALLSIAERLEESILPQEYEYERLPDDSDYNVVSILGPYVPKTYHSLAQKLMPALRAAPQEVTPDASAGRVASPQRMRDENKQECVNRNGPRGLVWVPTPENEEPGAIRRRLLESGPVPLSLLRKLVYS